MHKHLVITFLGEVTQTITRACGTLFDFGCENIMPFYKVFLHQAREPSVHPCVQHRAFGTFNVHLAYTWVVCMYVMYAIGINSQCMRANNFNNRIFARLEYPPFICTLHSCIRIYISRRIKRFWAIQNCVAYMTKK